MENQLFCLDGRVALITGGAGYLGASMAKGLAAQGAHVVLWGRTEKTLHEVAASINSEFPCSVEWQIVDLASSEDRLAAVQKFPCKKLDILINAAYSGGAGSTEYASASDFFNAYEISTVCAFDLVKYFLPKLIEAGRTNMGGASIINIGSMYGIVSPKLQVYDTPAGANPPFYGAAKAALLQLTRYWACEFGEKNIRVNGLSFGPFPNKKVQKQMPAFCDRLAARVPMRRIGQTSEVEGPVVFLASDASSYVNGTNLIVDGGWCAW